MYEMYIPVRASYNIFLEICTIEIDILQTDLHPVL